jgi:hypothetical protein
MDYLPGLASNCDPLNLSLPSSQDYMHEPLEPGSIKILLKVLLLGWWGFLTAFISKSLENQSLITL